MASSRFPADPAGARAARRFARAELDHLGPVAEIAELLVSELASNVVRHASTPFLVDVRPDGDPVRVVVSDGVFTDLRVAAAADDDTSGRGLLILDALAERWGVREVEGGKEVWFELRPDQRI